MWHTEDVGGPTLADTTAKFGFDSSVLGQAQGIWHRDAIIKDLSGTVTFTAEESADIMQAISIANDYLKSIDGETFAWLQQGTDLIGKNFLKISKCKSYHSISERIASRLNQRDFYSRNFLPWQLKNLYDQISLDTRSISRLHRINRLLKLLAWRSLSPDQGEAYQ